MASGGINMRNKRFILTAVSILLIVLMAFTAILVAADYKYVGSKKSNKYHYPDCRWAKKIKPSTLVTFTSAEEARSAGYVPCKVCKPPWQDG